MRAILCFSTTAIPFIQAGKYIFCKDKYNPKKKKLDGIYRILFIESHTVQSGSIHLHLH